VKRATVKMKRVAKTKRATRTRRAPAKSTRSRRRAA
jgi:hypothetical protein